MVNIYEAGPFEGRLEQWPVLAVSGALEVRLAETEHEVEQAQRLRYTVFYEEMSAIPSPRMRELRRDFDKYDDVCDHLLVVDRDAHDEDGQPLVVGTYRLTREKDAARAGGFYTAGEYDLAPMLTGPARRHEISGAGPFLRPQKLSRPPRQHAASVEGPDGLCRALRHRPDVRLRLAARHRCERNGAAAVLSAPFPRHARKAARARAPRTVRGHEHDRRKDQIDPREGLRSLPPLLKGYVRAGCCIGDGAVIDRQFGTTDVFIYFPLSGIDARYKSRFGLVK